jgi:RNA polymerase sigma factor (sigma-70 family)
VSEGTVGQLILDEARPAGSTWDVPMSVDLPEVEDGELVDRVRARDEDAFRALFRRYAPTALSLAQRVVRQPFLAEEIVQEAFLAVWRNPDGYDADRGSVRSWLMGTVHHRAVDVVRREGSQRRRALEALGADPVIVADPSDEVVDELGLPEERKAVRAALEDLPAEQRRVIELMYFGGLSQSTIAARLGLPLGTVKSRTLLGMRRLRTALLELR